jgi:hypothetical protein
MPWSAIDDGHVAFVVPLPRGRREVVEPFDLSRAQRAERQGDLLLAEQAHAIERFDPRSVLDERGAAQ